MTEEIANREHLARAWQNECTGWLTLGKVPGSAYHVERYGSITYAWWHGEPGAIDNYIMVEPDYTGALQPCIAPFMEQIRSSASPTTIRFMGTDRATEWAAEAEELGFCSTGEVPVMACALRSARGSIPAASEIAVRKADSEAAYRESLEVIHSVYGGSISITEFFNPKGPVQLYAAYWQGRAACASALWPFAGVAGIYSVATLPSYRQRGLALATLQAQLNDAEAAGYDLAILRTVDELIPFYGRLGFKQVGNVRSYCRADW